jgi:hypothetical protein
MPSDSWTLLNQPGWQERLRAREWEWSERDRRISRNDLRASIGDMSRAPLQDLMAVLLQSCPTEMQLYEWAEAHPDKWVSAIAAMARLAGYSDKLEVDMTHTLNVGNISDADLLQRLQELRDRLQRDGQNLTIEDASQSQHADNKKGGHDGPPS